jgi:diacylglycerol O-acyltransferase
VLTDDRTLRDTHDLTDALLATFTELHEATGFTGTIGHVSGPPMVER